MHIYWVYMYVWYVHRLYKTVDYAGKKLQMNTLFYRFVFINVSEENFVRVMSVGAYIGTLVIHSGNIYKRKLIYKYRFSHSYLYICVHDLSRWNE